jgi:hypothetical protein
MQQRWPQFVNRAVETGIRSMLSIRLHAEQDTYGHQVGGLEHLVLPDGDTASVR